MSQPPNAHNATETPDRLGRRSRMLRQRRIPIRYLVPNFFTLLSLCAGVTAIRAAIEARYELAIGLVVVAALLDAVDGRLARALKAQSRFGAELDSLADFVNFGVAPAIVLYTWGLGSMRSLGWISVLLFACAMSLRLARFNAAIDDNKPRWQSNYFTGVPAPAGAITVLLPLYLNGTGLIDLRSWPILIALYAAAIAALLVSTIPTYSGKLAGERISREYVAPVLAAAALLVGLLATYPYMTLSVMTLIYLAMIPWSRSRFLALSRRWAAGQPDPNSTAQTAQSDGIATQAPPEASDRPSNVTRH
ncbi:MAG: phosphatidylcholine/phosphatidylserine synthase [Hyphomicrobiaceae bacterium]